MITNGGLKKDIFDICIIGGGASGLAAGIRAKQLSKEASILVIEKNNSLGRKIKATGNGRCNITNVNAQDYLKVMKFFDSIGIITREFENGLVYPYSESAVDVTDILTDSLYSLGAQAVCNAEVTEVTRLDIDGETFELALSIRKSQEDKKPQKKKISAKNVIVATGGKAAPIFGSTGSGYRFARKFGHDVIKTIPILAGIECKGSELKNLAGVRAKARAMLYKNGVKTFEEDGEIQFTKYGLSGICIFNMTRFMRLGKNETFTDFEISIDLSPNLRIDEFIINKVSTGIKAKNLLTSLVKPALAAYIIKTAGIDNGEKRIDTDKAEKIIELIHNLRFFPTNIRKWEDAQCTSGGVNLDELNESCESKLVSGLFFTGEVIDYDGPCGGYNLTNAWYTGISAGEGAVRNLM